MKLRSEKEVCFMIKIKNLLSAIIIIVLTISLTTLNPIVMAEDSILKGDVDENGEISVDDASYILTEYARTAAGLSSILNENQLIAADIDANSSISVDDASYVLSYYAQNSAGLNPTWDSILGNSEIITTTETTTTTTSTTTTTTEIIVTESSKIPISKIPPITGNIFVVLNTKTMCYHLKADCRAAKKIASENYADTSVTNISEVEGYGYKACGICVK